MSVLQVDEVEKWWDDTAGLRPVSFRLPAGELVALRGRSGSGKSTLLAILAGWCRPDNGWFWLPNEVDPRRATWWDVAVVPQVLALVPELTIREMVAEAAGPARVDVDEVLEALDLRDVADRFPTDTSMGQQQRAAVARAVAARPKLLMADEPTSHQGSAHVELVVKALRDAADHGSSVLVATHDDAVVAAASGVVDLDIS